MRPWWMLGLAALLGGCAGLTTNVDYDPLYRFDDLKTYAWKRSAAEEVMDPFVVKYVQAAVHRELEVRGFARAQAPDFLVALRDEFADRMEVDQRTGAFRRTLNARDLHRDDLILDVLDASSNGVVWRGVAADVIDKRISSEDRRAQIEAGVKSLLEKFPPRP